MLSGKVKYVVLFIFSLLIASLANSQEGRIYKYHLNGNLQMGNVIANDQSIVLNYSISELNIESTTNSSEVFYKISIPGHSPSSEIGKPELPVLSRLITLPGNSRISIKISDVTSEKILPARFSFKGQLYPRQPGRTKENQTQRAEFIMDKTEYSKSGLIVGDTVKVDYIGKVREKELASLQINPVRYNPHTSELEVISSMRIEITFVPAGAAKSQSLKKGSLLFNESISNGVLNFNPKDLINGYSDQPVKMIIITDPAFKKNLQPFLKWKTQKGFRLTTIYKTSKLSTFIQLKDSLSKIYNSSSLTNPPPEYLLIIGDVNRIPSADGTNNTSDMYYGEFDGGGDYIPDMYIGRLPVADTNDLKTVINKIIQYEKFQFADTNKFYTRALVTSGNDNTYQTFMNGQVKYVSSNYLNKSNKIDGYNIYTPNNKIDTVKKLINKGLSFINYTGHGSTEGWYYDLNNNTYFLNASDINALTNKNMYPFVISNACRTALYSAPGSLGNTMIVTPNKGAVGYIGCSNDSYWDEDYYWAVGVGSPNVDPKYTETGLGALDRLFHTHGELPSDWYISMGQVNYAGNLSVSASTSSRKKYYWETYTLLGDPSTVPFIGTPETFKISLPDTLPNGIKSLSMTIPPFAYMAVSHFDTLWDASYASPSGTVVLDLPGLTNDSCLVIISGQNRIPVIKTIRIAQVKKEYINLTSSSINDSSGNNNGLADYGESLFLKLVISNLGTDNATGLYAKLRTQSSWIKIINDSVNIGTLTGKSQIALPACFGLTIADSIPDKGYLTLNLTLGDDKIIKNYTIDISIHSPVLEILNCLIDDSGTGNSNYIAEPGETFKLLFKIRNSGSSNIAGILNILNQPSQVTINIPSVNTGPLQYESVTTVPVSIKLASNADRNGSFDITAKLDCSPYIISRSFSIPIGKAKESFEYQKMTVFPWLNSSKNPWFITNSQSAEGQYSVRSAIIPNKDSSLLRMIVNLPVKDTIKFSVMVSSELNYDFLYFRLNGMVAFRISGETGWVEKKVVLKEGFNLLEWIYKKDESMSAGADCGWLDYIRFPLSAYNNKDLKTGKIVTPQPGGKNYNQEQITAEVINLGTDTVKNFNVAYTINSGNPVFQSFNRKINPSDTSIVSFNQTANLAGNGTYIIKVYGFNNNDNFLLNDTSKLTIVNTGFFDIIGKPDNSVRVIPNPFKRSFMLEIKSDTYDEIEISLVGQSGKVFWQERRMMIPGLNTYSITSAQPGSGLYILTIKGKTTYKNVRIMKLE